MESKTQRADVGMSRNWTRVSIGRRRLLTVLGGTFAYLALPARWSGTAIRLGMLPAHADTSSDAGNDGATADAAPTEAGTDANVDGGLDARDDVPADARTEGGADADAETVSDANRETSVDAGTEAGPAADAAEAAADGATLDASGTACGTPISLPNPSSTPYWILRLGPMSGGTTLETCSITTASAAVSDAALNFYTLPGGNWVYMVQQRSPFFALDEVRNLNTNQNTPVLPLPGNTPFRVTGRYALDGAVSNRFQIEFIYTLGASPTLTLRSATLLPPV